MIGATELTKRQRALRFAVVTIALVAVWLVVLPWLGRASAIRNIIDRNQAASIDPSALFYTDLEHLRYEDGLLRREP